VSVDRSVLRELATMPQGAIERICRHLAAAGLLLDELPAAALEHTLIVQELAPRSPSVREAVGVAAYLAQDYERARAALRSHRRMTGSAEHLALLADSERALGEPGRALEVAADPAAAGLPAATRVELAIVVSGARRDLGQPLAAVVGLREALQLAPPGAPGAGRVRFALGMALLEAGRTDQGEAALVEAADLDEDLAEEVALQLGWDPVVDEQAPGGDQPGL
jgi:Flp pilus assembly protein TadD